MPFLATVYKVMIASPSDVENERDTIREVIHEWNAVNAVDRAVVLLPVAWETHSSPSMGARAQEVINRQVLADCDLLVAVFWTRIGTPTGEFRSGTVEDIEKHIGQSKEAMIYFSSAPVRPESVNGEQYTALLEFMRRCRDRGLVEEYDSLSEFKDKFARQLAHTMIRICGRTTADVTTVSAVGAGGDTLLPALSDDAKLLLLHAVDDKHGTFLVFRAKGGVGVSTGGVSFGESGDRRNEARLERAIEELVEEALIEDTGDQGAAFVVTARGYEVADLLRGTQG